MTLKKTITILFSLLGIGCSTMKPNTVLYTVAQNYFVKNNVSDKNVFKIVSQADLDNYYGIARTMSDKSIPTAVDFNKSFAIAVVAPTSDIIKDLHIDYLRKGKDSLYLQYTIEKGEKRSFSTKATKLLIVDKQYDLPISVSEK